MIFVMMGPQACGKGTQGELLGKAFGLPLVASGQLLRDISPTHPMYEVVNEQMQKGILVDQSFVAGLIRERISKEDCSNGYILDGWMRSFIDVEAFTPNFNYIIYISIPREESVKRITGRRICEADGKTYNIYTLPAEELAKCPGPLHQRADDTKEAVNKRLEIFYTETMRVINTVKSEGKVLEINGLGSPDEVFSRILEALAEKNIHPVVKL